MRANRSVNSLSGWIGVVILFCAWCHVNAEAQAAEGESRLWDKLIQRSPWVFLGDSNTYAGRYVAEIDARLHLGIRGKAPRVLNLGMSSETASGLSEEDHPFKRPCIHQRLDKLLRIIRPQVVFICYGMNDGIYQPDNDEIFAAYREGMLRLARQVKQADAYLICITPPPFDPQPLAAKGKLGPSDKGRYAYFAPAPEYDEVLERQTHWCLSNEMGADLVIDIHSLLHRLTAIRQESLPSFSFTRDGIHFDATAHQAIASEILRAIGAPQEISEMTLPADTVGVFMERMRLLRDAYLTAVGKNRPGLPAGLPIWLAERKASLLIERYD